MTTQDDLIKTINDRFDALGLQVSEDRIRAIIAENLPTLANDPTFVRKMRFGAAPDPQLVGTKFARWGLTVADVEWLYELQMTLKGQRAVSNYGAYSGPSEILEKTFRAFSEALYLSDDEVKAIDKKAMDEMFPRLPLSIFRGYDRVLAAKGAWAETQEYQRQMRAMDSAESGYGSQLVGAQYVGELWQAARADSRVFALLDTIEMIAPTMYVPVEVDIPEMLFVGESTASNSSNYTTVKTGSQRVQLDAKKFVIHQMWSGELEEDSIIPFVPFLRRQLQLSIAHYSDSLVLNGDTTNAGTGNINLDDADPADTKHYLAFDGIRHAGIVDNTANKADQAGAITLSAFMDVRGRLLDNTYLHDWGHPTNADDLVHVADPTTCDKVAMLGDVLTVDKFGPGATVLSGMQARVLGHPLIASLAVSKTEADGKVSTTGSNNTKGQVVSFNRRGFKVGWRRRVRLEAERLPATDQTRLVSSLRLGFGRFSPTGSASGIESADVIYNISL